MVARKFVPEDLSKRQLCKLARAVIQDNFDVRWEMKDLKAENTRLQGELTHLKKSFQE